MKKAAALLVGLVMVFSIISFSGHSFAGDEGIRVVTIDGRTYLVSEDCKPSIDSCIEEAINRKGSNMEHHDYLGGG